MQTVVRETSNSYMMAGLSQPNLRLFYSTGIDCFGPFQVKLGCRCEKLSGILYKCLTKASYWTPIEHWHKLLSHVTKKVHSSQRETIWTPTQNFRMPSMHFTKPWKSIWLPNWSISVWTHQMHHILKSIMTALRTSLDSQSVSEEVLNTVLVEIEGILNSRPLAYISSAIADTDPVYT